MGRKTTIHIFQATNKRNLTREALDIAKILFGTLGTTTKCLERKSAKLKITGRIKTILTIAC